MNARTKTGVRAKVIAAIADAIALLADKPADERTAINLAKIAGTSRPTLYRAFTERPDLHTAFRVVTAADRARSEHETSDKMRVNDLRAENARLRHLVDALAAVAETLNCENLVLRAQTDHTANVTPIAQPTGQ